MSAWAVPELLTWISYSTSSPNSKKLGPPSGSSSGTKLAISVTVSGLSGDTNAYTSVLSAAASLTMPGGSLCDDIAWTSYVRLDEMSGPQRAAAARGVPGGSPRADDQRPVVAACARARARAGLCTRTCCSPVKRSTSPVFASCTCATSGVLTAAASLADALLEVAAEAAPAVVSMSMPAATPAMPMPPAPRSRPRRDMRAFTAGSDRLISGSSWVMNDSFSWDATARTGRCRCRYTGRARAEGTFDWAGRLEKPGTERSRKVSESSGLRREVQTAVLRATQSLVFGADGDPD